MYNHILVIIGVDLCLLGVDDSRRVAKDREERRRSNGP